MNRNVVTSPNPTPFPLWSINPRAFYSRISKKESDIEGLGTGFSFRLFNRQKNPKQNKTVTTVASGRSVKCNAIFAVWDLSLGFKTLLLICSPVWILDIPNIWEHHAKVRTTNTHNIVLHVKIWFPGHKTFWIFKTCPLTTSRDSCTWQELTA